MEPVRWKGLCLDANDPGLVTGFWARALRRTPHVQDDGDGVLRGDAPGQTVWVNRVPEPKTAKNRAHLDLVAPSLSRFLEAGAGHVQDDAYAGHRWAVLQAPEGAELCVFTGDEPSALVVDSNDPVADAAWWAAVLGGTPVPAPGGLPRWVAGIPELPFDLMKFVGVPEPKTVKNRVHWDVTGDVGRLVDRGARVLAEPDGEAGWHVLADPAGNEFCVFPPALDS
ncbi:VOC family protein [Motilibacter aurantiacus]|uniref:VOC family protein n=1 Tax=Motilibacter aurantiacus TaxID=2714955 RepID=UPI00140CED1A|nr:VOC family protein [Motilibacter aurantiacus]NHC44799.1 hypothetical protein [Motilibacter aurantiacus]